MQLNKLFNYKYFKENIKKAKGTIILLIGLIPFFTALVTLILNKSVSSQQTSILEIFDISWINLIGMYILPIILSATLFSYIFKKSSVDLIGSMPINKKTIFTTNTIGGIALIFIMQTINAVILLMINQFIKSYVIFPEMITQVYIMMLFSYIFIYTAANLAICITGTKLAQIIVTLLLVFLPSFIVDGINSFNLEDDYQISANFDSIYSEEIEITKEIQSSKTLPYALIFQPFSGDIEDMKYENIIIKTIIYNVIFVSVGIIVFTKRKMEISEESFENEKKHTLIKSITLIPVIILITFLIMKEEIYEITSLIIPIALIITYYFIFDIILKRKINFRTNCKALIITIVVIAGVFAITNTIYTIIKSNQIELDDIKKVSIELQEIYEFKYLNTKNYFENISIDNGYDIFSDYNSLSYSTKNYFSNKDIYIEDNEVINLIYEYCIEYSNYEASTDEKSINITISFIDKNNNKYNEKIRLYESQIEKLLVLIEEKYSEEVMEFEVNSAEITFFDNVVSKNAGQDIIEIIKENINEINTYDYCEKVDNVYIFLELSYYEDMNIKTRYIPINLSTELLNKCIEVTNEDFKENFNKTALSYSNETFDTEYYKTQKINGDYQYTKKSSYDDYYELEYAHIKNILEKDLEFDNTKDFIIIEYEPKNSSYETYKYFINASYLIDY